MSKMIEAKVKITEYKTVYIPFNSNTEDDINMQADDYVVENFGVESEILDTQLVDQE